MGYLLDTHTLLWFLGGDNKLPIRSKELIEDINNHCYVSIISLWEIVIKRQIGKLNLEMELSELFQFISRNQIEILSIEVVHLMELSLLPSHHNDPFDRLILSQAIAENMIVIGCDEIFTLYPVKMHWK